MDAYTFDIKWHDLVIFGVTAINNLVLQPQKYIELPSTRVLKTMANQRQNGLREDNTSSCSYTISFVIGLLCILIGVVLVVVGSVRLQSAKKPCGQEDPTAARRTSPSTQKGTCKYSAEAVRVGLPGLLEEVKKAYFEYNPNNVAWHPDKRRGGIVEVVEYVKTRCVDIDDVENVTHYLLIMANHTDIL